MLGRLEKTQLPRGFYGADWRTTSKSLVQIFSARIESMSSFSSAHHGALFFPFSSPPSVQICSRSWMHRWIYGTHVRILQAPLLDCIPERWGTTAPASLLGCIKILILIGAFEGSSVSFFLLGGWTNFMCRNAPEGGATILHLQSELLFQSELHDCQRTKASHCLYVSHGPWLKIFN